MARPIKEGMDYFPHDTDAANDEKIEALRAIYGNDGYAFYFILLERIYRSGTFELDVSDPDTIQILARKVAVTPELFSKMLTTALKVDCFDRQAYAERKVITSNGIKKRAQFVNTKRRRMRDSYHGEKERVSAAETMPETGVSAAETGAETPQSKVKKSKEKESKEKESIVSVPAQVPANGDPGPAATNPKTKAKAHKINYREYVHLTPEQHQMLQHKYGPAQTEAMLDILDNYKGSRGRTYKDDYRAILSWVVTRYQEDRRKGVYHGQAGHYPGPDHPGGSSELREFIQNRGGGEDDMH